MVNLISAIKTKLSGSALYNDVGGRVFLDEADQGAEFPYIVFFIVSGVPEKTFTEDMENVLLQFSLFSALSAGDAIMTTMYADLKALFDECSLSITGSTLIWMRRQNLTTMVEADITLPDGSNGVRHWAVDYEVFTSLN